MNMPVSFLTALASRLVYSCGMGEAVEKAKQLVKNNEIMIIATADGTGKPWISPVFFNFDDAYNLYWVSYKEAEHSKNIRTRPEVAITIVGSSSNDSFIDDAVYIDAEARELSDKKDILPAIQVMMKRQQIEKFMIHGINDVTGNAAWRIYKAVPRAAWKRNDKDLKVNGQVITTRAGVKLQ